MYIICYSSTFEHLGWDFYFFAICHHSNCTDNSGSLQLARKATILLVVQFFINIPEGPFQNWRTFYIPPMKFQIAKNKIQNHAVVVKLLLFQRPTLKKNWEKKHLKIFFKIPKTFGVPPYMLFFSLNSNENCQNCIYIYFFVLFCSQMSLVDGETSF